SATFCQQQRQYKKIIHLAAYTLRKSLQTTSALSATSKQCFEQPAASFLVCSLIFIEYKKGLFNKYML
ncbi:hypothetical protein J5E63_05655, partial [Streptococcus pneumoniae]|uniref:hypothetical protein n=1 Tax=Streptococcus pneumoniae TaxID=1313 RepID=UPI001C625E84